MPQKDNNAEYMNFGNSGFLVGREHARKGTSSPLLQLLNVNGGLISKPWHPSRINTTWFATRNHKSEFEALNGQATLEERNIHKRYGDLNGLFHWFSIPVTTGVSGAITDYFRDYKERPQGYYNTAYPVMMEKADGVSVSIPPVTPGGGGSGPASPPKVTVTKSAGADDRTVLPIFDIAYPGESRDPNNPDDDRDRYFSNDFNHQADPRIPNGEDDTHTLDTRMRKMVYKGQDDIPGGTPGIVLTCTREDEQIPIMFPIVGMKIPGMDENSNALIIHHREEGPAKFSTLFADISGNNRDPSRTAGLQGSLAIQKIDRMPGSVDPTSEFFDPDVPPEDLDFDKPGGATCTLVYAKPGEGVGGFGLKTSVGVGQSGDIKSNDFTGAFTSWVRSGYSHAGVPGGGDKHDCLIGLDGQAINSDHIWYNGYFFMDVVRDAPLDFEASPWEEPGDRGNWKLVHLRYDGNPRHSHWTGSKQGKWRWEVRVPEITGEPPTDEPPYIPYTPWEPDVITVPVPVPGTQITGAPTNNPIAPGAIQDSPDNPATAGTPGDTLGGYVDEGLPLGGCGPEMAILTSSASRELRLETRRNLGNKPRSRSTGTGNIRVIPDPTSPNLNGLIPVDGFGWEPSRRYETFAGPQMMGIAIPPRDREQLNFGRFNVDTPDQRKNWESAPLSSSLSAFGSVDGEEWDYDTPQEETYRLDRAGIGRYRLKGIATRGGWFIHSPAIDLQDEDYQSEDTPEVELIIQADNGSFGLGYPSETGYLRDGFDFTVTGRNGTTGYRDLEIKAFDNDIAQDTVYESTVRIYSNLDVKGEITQNGTGIAPIIEKVTQAGHSLSRLDIVYLDTDGDWKTAYASGGNTAADGMISKVSGSELTIIRSGTVSGSAAEWIGLGLAGVPTDGTEYFLDLDGGLTDSAIASASKINQSLGLGLGNGSFYFTATDRGFINPTSLDSERILLSDNNGNITTSINFTYDSSPWSTTHQGGMLTCIGASGGTALTVRTSGANSGYPFIVSDVSETPQVFVDASDSYELNCPKFHCTGKATIDGLIDPTGLQLATQASTPASSLTLWVNSNDNNKLYWTDGDAVDNEVALNENPIEVHGLSLNEAKKINNYTLTASDDIIYCDPSEDGDFWLGLPDVDTVPKGKKYEVWSIASGTVTIYGCGTNINGAASCSISTQYGWNIFTKSDSCSAWFKRSGIG